MPRHPEGSLGGGRMGVPEREGGCQGRGTGSAGAPEAPRLVAKENCDPASQHVSSAPLTSQPSLWHHPWADRRGGRETSCTLEERGPRAGPREWPKAVQATEQTGHPHGSKTVVLHCDLAAAASSGPPGFALHLVEDSGPRVPGRRIKDTGTTSQSDTAGECQTQSNSAGGLSRGRFWRIVF